jgi:hypothetical protein
MKIALITGGQPRFTEDFITLMNQLKGFDSADVYMALWKTEWAETDEQAEEKIKKTLLPNFNIGKVKILDEPVYQLPPHNITFDPPSPQNLLWWYKRTYCQAMGISLAFDLIDKEYDLVIRFRLDGSLDKEINLSALEFKDTDIIFPAGPNSGFINDPINDQFAIGTMKGMEFYSKLGKEFLELVPLSDPNWMADGRVLPVETWSWGLEYLLVTLLKKYNKPKVFGDFYHFINNHGRSKFTDKHYHHGIAKDPTQQ